MCPYWRERPAHATIPLAALRSDASLPAMQSADPAPDARYQARGVSAGKAEVHAAIADQDRGLFPGAFCKLIPDLLAGSAEHCLVLHADGAGTKSALAYLAWRETGDPGVWRGIAQDSLVMNLDDCACVGALGPFLVSNTIGRNAKRIPGEVVRNIVEGYQDVCDTLASQGIDCVMCGGETADVGDLVRTAICDSTVVARIARTAVIDAARMAPGQALIGFSSTGQAAWESAANAGIGSNGLTSARHDALGSDYAARYPETYAPETDPALIYAGPYRLDDPLPDGAGLTVGQALLSPTRTYLPLIHRLLAALAPGQCTGLIHASGGGQAKIAKFGAPGNRYLIDAPFPVPPLFRMLQQVSGTAWREAYTVWNMGCRLLAAVQPEAVDTCVALAADCHIEARVVGRIEAGSGPGREVELHGEGGVHRYAG